MTKRKNPNQSSEAVLFRVTRALITSTGAKKVDFNPWSVPLSGTGTARIRFARAYSFESGGYWWAILPGSIENDPDGICTRGLYLVPVSKSDVPAPTKDFFGSLFRNDIRDRSIQIVSQRNGTFKTNGDAPHMGRYAAMLSLASPVTGTDTPTKIALEDEIIGPNPTVKRFSLSGEIQYRKSYAKTLTLVFMDIVSRYV